jgi:HK97 family phage major capsid protein
MSFVKERQALEELNSLRASAKPMFDKLERGMRLSAAESRRLAEISDRTTDLRSEVLDYQAARELSASEAPASPAFGGDDTDAETRALSHYIRTGIAGRELRSAGEATGSAGGYLVPPGWWQRLQVALKAYGGTASDFQPLETETGQPMNWATTDPTSVVASLIAENTQISDQDYVFGQGVLNAFMYTSGVQKVSFQLAQDSAFNIDQFVEARVSESLGRKVAADAISGSGSNQPLGVITALNAATGLSSGGVYTLGTGNKVNIIASGSSMTSGTAQVTELTAGALNPNSVVAIIKAVDPAYRALGAKFYMPDTVFQSMKLVADSFGQPFYKDLQDDTNPRLYGYPVVVDNNIPNLTASTASGIIFGHLPSAMVMRTVRGAGLLRLEERYADFLQVGFIGYRRVDVRANDLRAAVVVKAAAS